MDGMGVEIAAHQETAADSLKSITVAVALVRSHDKLDLPSNAGYVNRPAARACTPESSYPRGPAKFVCDHYVGYTALFEQGVIEVSCMARARRKLHDLYANHHCEIAGEGLRLRCPVRHGA